MATAIYIPDEADVRDRLNAMLSEGGGDVRLHVLTWLHDQFEAREIGAATSDEACVYKNALDAVDDAMAELLGWDAVRGKRRG